MSNRDTVVLVFGVDPFRIGSGETFARELAAQAGARGWRCVLCYLAHPREPVRQFLELPNVNIEIVEDVWRLAWRPTRALAGVLRKYRPRILHLNYTGMLGPYPWAARLLGVEKIFLTDHGSRPADYIPVRAPAWKRFASRLLNAPMTSVICVSRHGYRCLIALDLLPKDRFQVIYNAVDIQRAAEGCRAAAEFRRKYSIAPDRLLVTQVSWMIPEKGVQDLLEAARQVIAQESKVHFLLAGDGAQRRDYERMAYESGLADHVTFTGTVLDPLADGLFAASDVVCQMSRWQEVFGYVLTEAMASVKPVVATRVGGIPEVVQDGVTGFLVERGDINGMAARILELLRAPELRARMGEAGLRAVHEKFELTANVAQLLRLYGI